MHVKRLKQVDSSGAPRIRRIASTHAARGQEDRENRYAKLQAQRAKRQAYREERQADTPGYVG